MNNIKKFAPVAFVFGLLAVAILFQNCGQDPYTQDKYASSSNSSTGDDPNPPNPDPGPTPLPNPNPQPPVVIVDPPVTPVEDHIGTTPLVGVSDTSNGGAATASFGTISGWVIDPFDFIHVKKVRVYIGGSHCSGASFVDIDTSGHRPDLVGNISVGFDGGGLAHLAGSNPLQLPAAATFDLYGYSYTHSDPNVPLFAYGLSKDPQGNIKLRYLNNQPGLGCDPNSFLPN